MQPDSLFTGPDSLRWRTERRALWLTLIFAPMTVGLVGYVLREQLTGQQIAFLVVAAMVYVSIARGRLLGTSVRLHERQLPAVYAIASRCARDLGMRMPQVFVREDQYTCVTSMGLGEPYSIVISSTWLPYLDDQELSFLIGRELGHIAAGHSRITSLFTASGRENPFISIVFGAWLRRTEYTADRVGLLCCGSIDAAARAIFTCAFHQVSKRVDYTAFIDQRVEVQSDPTLKLGELLGQEPYATNRLRNLENFVASPLYASWRVRFDAERERNAQRPAPTTETTTRGTKIDARDLAGNWVRAAAFGLDWIIVSAIVSSGEVLKVDAGNRPSANHPAAFSDMAALSVQQYGVNWLNTHLPLFQAALPDAVGFVCVFLYAAVLVGLVGRTFGMMVLGLRVVRPDYRRVGAGRAAWRYIVTFFSMAFVVPMCGFLWRPALQDRITDTRVVRGSLNS
ncbi:MAG TPA: M48 family metalloprotease [Candidatus Eremiobacteraceae bacterium]|nr:M48 family metalloprotease [Candidatus Eremiobacteraceae bacterium]